jgi:hypothetical protein
MTSRVKVTNTVPLNFPMCSVCMLFYKNLSQCLKLWEHKTQISDFFFFFFERSEDPALWAKIPVWLQWVGTDEQRCPHKTGWDQLATQPHPSLCPQHSAAISHAVLTVAFLREPLPSAQVSFPRRAMKDGASGPCVWKESTQCVSLWGILLLVPWYWPSQQTYYTGVRGSASYSCVPHSTVLLCVLCKVEQW